MTDSEATLRIKQQIMTAAIDDPAAVPDLIIDLGLADPVAAAALIRAIARADS